MKFEYFPVLTKDYLNRVYDSMEFTLATGQTDYDVAANVTGAYENIKIYTTITLRSDQNLTIKLNSSSYRSITVTAGRPFELDSLIEISNIFITNASGSTANIKIIGVRKGA